MNAGKFQDARAVWLRAAAPDPPRWLLRALANSHGPGDAACRGRKTSNTTVVEEFLASAEAA